MEWRTTDRFPGYEVNRAGVVRHVETKRVLQVYRGTTGKPFVRRSRACAERPQNIQVNILLEITFGAGAAVAAGLTEPHTSAGAAEAAPCAVQRRCHDCGKLTTDYRCHACWKKLRACASGEDDWFGAHIRGKYGK
jgi:hypothetical protein